MINVVIFNYDNRQSTIDDSFLHGVTQRCLAAAIVIANVLAVAVLLLLPLPLLPHSSSLCTSVHYVTVDDQPVTQ